MQTSKLNYMHGAERGIRRYRETPTEAEYRLKLQVGAYTLVAMIVAMVGMLFLLTGVAEVMALDTLNDDLTPVIFEDGSSKMMTEAEFNAYYGI